jgi:tetratricopeptide (TPR) repeat protein
VIKVLRPGAVLLLAALVVPAQTLQQAEAYWKARNFGEANNAFKALVELYPTNPEYRVRWGRMFLDHGTADDIQNASDLFNEALAIKKDDADAALGLALISADEFSGAPGAGVESQAAGSAGTAGADRARR